MPTPEPDWDTLVKRIANGTCIPFLGAGASLGAGIPTAATLAESVATKHNYPGAERWDFLRVLQYCLMKTDRHQPRHEIATMIGEYTTPGHVHNTLAALPFSVILTTNFDPLMETALKKAGKLPQPIVYRATGDKADIDDIPHPTRPLVYKLHGDLSDLDSMIVTEDDVIEFLASVMLKAPPLPAMIETIIRNYSVLFIGYGLKDWNVRVLLRALRGFAPSKDCFAVQQRPDDEAFATEWDATIMHLKNNRLNCYDIDASQFVDTLYDRFKAQFPAQTLERRG